MAQLARAELELSFVVRLEVFDACRGRDKDDLAHAG